MCNLGSHDEARDRKAGAERVENYQKRFEVRNGDGQETARSGRDDLKKEIPSMATRKSIPQKTCGNPVGLRGRQKSVYAKVLSEGESLVQVSDKKIQQEVLSEGSQEILKRVRANTCRHVPCLLLGKGSAGKEGGGTIHRPECEQKIKLQLKAALFKGGGRLKGEEVPC